MTRENEIKWTSELNQVVKRKGNLVKERLIVDCTSFGATFIERTRAAAHLAKKLNAMDDGLTLGEINLPEWKKAVHAGLLLKARNLLAVEEPLITLAQIIKKVDDYALTARGTITAKALADMRLELLLLRNRVNALDKSLEVKNEVPAVGG